MKRTLAGFAFLGAFAGVCAAQPDVLINTPVVKAYETIELSIDSDFGASNPYDYAAVNVSAVFRHSGGKTVTVDGFYMADYEYDAEKNSYAEKGGGFRIRFTPDRAGKWRYTVKAVKNKKTIFEPKRGEFECVQGGSKGFIGISRVDPLFFEYSNRERYFPVGMNMSWYKEGGFADYVKWVERFSSHGGDLIRVWMANWSFGIEWDGPIGDYGKRQKHAFMLDQVFGLCESLGVKIMLTLVPHGEFSTRVNTNWEWSPYNIKNDGLFAEPEKFFTDKVAKEAFKNRLRYIVARWGYSTALFAWEAFNEVDLTDNYNSAVSAAWHDEVGRYIRSLDPYNHLYTTSFSDPYKDARVFKLDVIDMAQTHIYGLKDPGSKIYEISRHKLNAVQKPHILGEYGIDAFDDFIKSGRDKEGVSVQDGIWGGVFSMSAGTPMPWYWDDYVDPNNLYYHFWTLKEFIRHIDWPREEFDVIKNRLVYYKDTKGKKTGDAVIYPSDAWTRAQKNKFLVTRMGEVTDSEYFTGYLFGSGHADMKNDPVIVVKNESPARMKIHVSGVSHENFLAVNINGTDALGVTLNAEGMKTAEYKEEWKIYQAAADIVIEAGIPRGDNEVIIENRGLDWIRIKEIRFEGVVNPDVAPVFAAGVQGPRSAYIWLKNRTYTLDKRDPEKITGACIDIAGLDSGRYNIEIYDIENAQIIRKYEEIAEIDPITVELPEFERSLAVKVYRYGVVR